MGLHRTETLEAWHRERHQFLEDASHFLRESATNSEAQAEAAAERWVAMWFKCAISAVCTHQCCLHKGLVQPEWITCVSDLCEYTDTKSWLPRMPRES